MQPNISYLQYKMSEEVINLDNLKEKQKMREFKATAKDIKSKDFDTRNKALHKLRDFRYYTEGDCIISLLESISMNKKTTELSRISIDMLLIFLEGAPDDAIKSVLERIINESNDLSCFETLSNIIMFKEDIKMPKVRKNEAPVAVPVENPIYGLLRKNAIKALYLMQKLSINSAIEEAKLWKAWSKIPNLCKNLCDSIKIVVTDTNGDKDTRYEALQRGIWILNCLEKILKYDLDITVEYMLKERASEDNLEGSTFHQLSQLMMEPCLKLQCMKVFHIISLSDTHLNILSKKVTLNAITEIVRLASNDIKTYQEQSVVAATSKQKPNASKPVAKGKKGEVIAENLEIKLLVADANRLAAVFLKLGVFMVTRAAENFPSTVLDYSTAILDAVKILLESNYVWKLLPNSPKLLGSLGNELSDVSTNDLIEWAVRCCGGFGGLSNEIRKHYCVSGLVTAVLEVLKSSFEASSMEILDDANLSSPMGKSVQSHIATPNSSSITPTAIKNQCPPGEYIRLCKFRSVIEKCITVLLLDKSPADGLPVHETDASRIDEESVQATKLSSLMDIIQQTVYENDHDLCGRGIRIFSWILQRSADAKALIKSAMLDTSVVVSTLALVFELTGTALVNELSDEYNQKIVAKSLERELAIADDKRSSDNIDEAMEAVDKEINELYLSDTTPIPVAAIIDAKNDSTPQTDGNVEDVIKTNQDVANHIVSTIAPSHKTNCYDLLQILCHYSDISQENVVTIVGPLSSEGGSSRVSLLPRLLSLGGPICMKSDQSECKIPRYDYGLIDWSLHDENRFKSSIQLVNLRPKLLQMASTIVLASIIVPTGKVLNNSGDGSAYPVLITSGSICEDSSMLVCLECCDVVFQMLLLGKSLQYNNTSQSVTFKVSDMTEVYPLEDDVVSMALEFVHSVGKTGVLGVCASLESISRGFTSSDDSNMSSISFLRKIFASLIPSIDDSQISQLVDDYDGDALSAINSIINAPYTWIRPRFYDEVISDANVQPSKISHLLKNKTLWPFFVTMAGLLFHIADTRLSDKNVLQTLRIIELYIRTSEFDALNQPVLLDIFSSVFLSIGGGVVLAGLCGRFGLFPYGTHDDGVYGLSLLQYIINRGYDREKYWTNYHEERRLNLEIDPKSGKPKSAKKRDKEKDKDKVKRNKKGGGFVGPIIEDISFNLEPEVGDNMAIANPDPNHGPSLRYWAMLLDTMSPDPYTHSQSTAITHVLVQSSMKTLTASELNADSIGSGQSISNDSLVLSMLDNYNIDINAHDLPNGMTPLMYSFLFNNDTISSYLVSLSKQPSQPVAAPPIDSSILSPAMMASPSKIYASPSKEKLRGNSASSKVSNGNVKGLSKSQSSYSPMKSSTVLPMPLIQRHTMDLDSFDIYGNPLIKYAFLSLSGNQIGQVFKHGHIFHHQRDPAKKASIMQKTEKQTIEPVMPVVRFEDSKENLIPNVNVEEDKLANHQNEMDEPSYKQTENLSTADPGFSIITNFELFGNANLLHLLKDSNIDVNIPDDCDGNYPLHYALGLCDLKVTIAGYDLQIRHVGNGKDTVSQDHPEKSQNLNLDDGATQREFDMISILHSLGADVNICNIHGVCPIHLAALKGNLDVLRYFITRMNAYPNICHQSNKYLAFHYLSLGCPNNAVECFQYLSTACDNLPIEYVTYQDNRKTKTRSTKYKDDLFAEIQLILDEAINPSAFHKHRLSINKMLVQTTALNENILHLSFGGHCFDLDQLPRVRSFDISTNQTDRMRFVLHLLEKLKDLNILTELLQGVDAFQTTILHVSTLLFQGITPKTQMLSQKELKSKRMKKYESIEKNILDIIYSTLMTSSIFQFRDCLQISSSRVIRNRHLPGSKMQPEVATERAVDHSHREKVRGLMQDHSNIAANWTVLHGVISSNNYEYGEYLIYDMHYPLYTHAYIHFLANHVNCHPSMMRLFVRAYTKSQSPHSIAALNGIDLEYQSRPLHIAIYHGNAQMIQEMFRSVKVNVNLREDVFGYTPLHLACILGDASIIDLFEKVIERVDVLITDKAGNTCIEYMIANNRVNELKKLLTWRKNDIIERFLCDRGAGRKALLVELEEENIRLVELLKPRYNALFASSQSIGGDRLNDPEMMMFPTDDNDITFYENSHKVIRGHSPDSVMMMDRSFKKNVDDEMSSYEDIVSEAFKTLRMKEKSFKLIHEQVSMVSSVDYGTVSHVDEPTQSEDTIDGLNTNSVVSTVEITDEQCIEYLDLLQKNSDILRVILPVIQGIRGVMIDKVPHAHPCFDEGKLYQEMLTIKSPVIE